MKTSPSDVLITLAKWALPVVIFLGLSLMAAHNTANIEALSFTEAYEKVITWVIPLTLAALVGDGFIAYKSKRWKYFFERQRWGVIVAATSVASMIGLYLILRLVVLGG